MSKDVTYRRLIQAPRWRMIRNAYLADHPQCEDCLKRGIHTAANCVHHVVPVETARDEQMAEMLCYSMSNLRALCIPCHAAIHAAERSHSVQAHKQRVQDRLQRFKADNPAPKRSAFDNPRGCF